MFVNENSKVLVLNASMEALTFVSWKRAVTLVVAGEAVIEEHHPGLLVRSARRSIPMPKVIKLVKYVYVKYIKPKIGHPTKTRVLKRDAYTCIYCQKEAFTVDHIIPKSRGGAQTWENLAASCSKCNSKKGNKTPEEAGMVLLWTPKAQYTSRWNHRLSNGYFSVSVN